MLTDDERVTLEVLEIASQECCVGLLRSVLKKWDDGTATPEYARKCQYVAAMCDDDEGRLTPAGRAELNRLRKKVEAGNE